MLDYPIPPFRPSIVSTKVHAVWDYLVGLVLIGSPWLAGFVTDARATGAVWVSGGLVLLLATSTDYEGGLIKKMVLAIHLAFDRLIGSFLGASPWLLEFADRVYWPHLILGLLLVVGGLITKRKPLQRRYLLTTTGRAILGVLSVVRRRRQNSWYKQQRNKHESNDEGRAEDGQR